MEKTLEWIFGAVLVAVLAVPLLVFNELFFPFITSKGFAFRILVDIALVFGVILMCMSARYVFRVSPITLAFGVFTLIILIADCFGLNPAKSLFSNFERMEGWITLLHVFFYTTLLEMWFRAGEKRVEKYVWWSLGISTLISFYGTLQVAGLLTINQGGVRVDGTFGNAAYYAAYLLFHIFFSLWLAWKHEGKYRIIALLPLLLHIPMLYFTSTRGAILGVVGGLAVSGIIMAVLSKTKAVRITAITFLGTLLLVGGIFLAVRGSDAVQQDPLLGRLANISFDVLDTRLALWGMAWEGFLERPLLGYGQENFNLIFNKYYDSSLYAQEPWFDRAHNSFIDWLVAGGVLGLLSYLSLWVILLYTFIRRAFHPADTAILTGLLVAYGIHSSFVFDNLGSYILFSIILAYAGTRLSPFLERSITNGKEYVYLVSGGMGILFLIALSAFHIPAISKNMALISAVSPVSSLGELESNFNSALGVATPLGHQEVREQLLQMGLRVAEAENLSMEERGQFLFFATSEMKKQIEEHPGDARTLLFYATGLRTLGNFTESSTILEKAIALSPQKQTLYFERGNSELLQGKLEEATVWFKKAYDLNPKNPQAVFVLAMGYIVSGNTTAGEDLLIASFGTRDVYDPALVAAYEQVGNTARAHTIRALNPNI